jgi:hypothetical protein
MPTHDPSSIFLSFLKRISPEGRNLHQSSDKMFYSFSLEKYLKNRKLKTFGKRSSRGNGQISSQTEKCAWKSVVRKNL